MKFAPTPAIYAALGWSEARWSILWSSCVPADVLRIVDTRVVNGKGGRKRYFEIQSLFDWLDRTIPFSDRARAEIEAAAVEIPEEFRRVP